MNALVNASPETVVEWDIEEIDGTSRASSTRRSKTLFLKKKLGKVAYAKKEFKFAAEYKELMILLKDRPEIRMWLRNVDPQLWSLAMDNGGMR
ncbi:hypothetical protein QQ045_005255 [Rhodiola kirilowii]